MSLVLRPLLELSGLLFDRLWHIRMCKPVEVLLPDWADPGLPDPFAAAPDRVETIKTALTRFAADTAVHDIHNVRVRDTDAGEIVNFHCRAAPSMSVIKVHENVDEIERALRRAFPTVKRVISHAEPPDA